MQGDWRPPLLLRKGGGDAVSSSELWSELGGVGILFEEVELVCWSVGVVALLRGR